MDYNPISWIWQPPDCCSHWVILLEEGNIREAADHLELLTRGDLYRQLYQRQLELVASGAEEARCLEWQAESSFGVTPTLRQATRFMPPLLWVLVKCIS